MKKKKIYPLITALLALIIIASLTLPVGAAGIAHSKPTAITEEDGSITYTFEVTVPIKYASAAFEIALEVPDEATVTKTQFKIDDVLPATVGPTIDPVDGYYYSAALASDDVIEGSVKVIYQVNYAGDPDTEALAYVRFVMFATQEQALESSTATRIYPDYPIALNEAAEEPDTSESTEPSDTEPHDSEPHDSEPSDSEPSDTESSETQPTETSSSETVPSDSEPSEIEPSDTMPSDTEPSDTVPSATEALPSEPSGIEPTGSSESTSQEDYSPESTEPTSEATSVPETGSNTSWLLLVSLILLITGGVLMILTMTHQKKRQ